MLAWPPAAVRSLWINSSSTSTARLRTLLRGTNLWSGSISLHHFASSVRIPVSWAACVRERVFMVSRGVGGMVCMVFGGSHAHIVCVCVCVCLCVRARMFEGAPPWDLALCAGG